MPDILSRAEFATLKELGTKEGRLATRRFLLEGWRALGEALRAGAEPLAVFIDQARTGTPDAKACMKLLAERRFPVRPIAERDLQRLSAAEQSPGVLATMASARHDPAAAVRNAGLAVALDEVADPGNLGATLRTAEWFGAAGVWLGQGCVELHNPKAVRATAGALFHLPIAERVALPAALRQARAEGFRVVALAGDGDVPLPKLRPSRRDLVVFGGEARGVTREVRAEADAVVAIPRIGREDSLNIAVAAGVVLAHLALPKA